MSTREEIEALRERYPWLWRTKITEVRTRQKFGFPLTDEDKATLDVAGLPASLPFKNQQKSLEEALIAAHDPEYRLQMANVENVVRMRLGLRPKPSNET